MFLKVSPRSPKRNFMIRPCKPKWIESNKYETLSSSSKNFERDTYKGGRGALAPRPPPFVGLSLSLSHKLFRLVLKSRIFPFNPFWLAGANHQIRFLGESSQTFT